MSYMQEKKINCVLENDTATTKDGFNSSVPPTLELRPPQKTIFSTQKLPETTAQNTTTSMLSENTGGNTSTAVSGGHIDQAGQVPVYAIPDKVRSKVMP